MNVNDKGLSNFKVKEEDFYCRSTSYSHSRVFNNDHNSYPKMAETAPSL